MAVGFRATEAHCRLSLCRWQLALLLCIASSVCTGGMNYTASTCRVEARQGVCTCIRHIDSRVDPCMTHAGAGHAVHLVPFFKHTKFLSTNWHFVCTATQLSRGCDAPCLIISHQRVGEAGWDQNDLSGVDPTMNHGEVPWCLSEGRF